jgi:DNA-binding beta-propeller fold protein YncE
VAAAVAVSLFTAAAPMSPVAAAPMSPVAAATTAENHPITLFAKIGAPGYPDGIVTAPDGDVYVSTNRPADAAGVAAPLQQQVPSRIYRYRGDGHLKASYQISGQVAADHGLMGMVFDGRGRLYVVDYAPARILRLDPATGAQQTYATIPTLPCGSPACGSWGQPWPVDLAFGPDGTLYVTDLQQSAIFAVPPGGGTATPWSVAPQWSTPFGVSGIALDGPSSLIVDVTGAGLTDAAAPQTARGAVYRVPIEPDGTAGVPRLLYATAPGEAPDSFALGASGRIYLCTLLTNEVIVIGPDGQELTRIRSGPADAVLDGPAMAAFRGTDLLVTNLTFFSNNPDHQTVVRIPVQDTAAPAYRPILPG